MRIPLFASLPHLVLPVMLFLAGSSGAQVPNLVGYQGRVAVGTLNFNGSGQFKFALVNAAGTTTHWSNNGSSTAGSQPTAAVSLMVTKGLYSVLLGDTSLTNMQAIPASVWSNADVRLRIWFNDGTNGFQLLTPDQRLAPGGYLPDGVVGTGKIADGAISTAKIAAGAVGSAQLGSNLTLNGTVNGTFSGGGAGLTGLNASQITGGTLPTGRLGTDVALRKGGNTFDSNQILTDGRLGIGSTAPAAKLEIQGGAETSGANDPRALAFAFSSGGYRHFIRSRHNSDKTGNALDFFLNNQFDAGDSIAPGNGNDHVMTLENGGLRLPDNVDLYLRSGGDVSHGLAWYGSGNMFAGVVVDGPVLYGWSGGALASKGGGNRIALRWDNSGRVGIGVTNPGATLDVGITDTRRLRMKTDTNNIPLIEAVSSDTGDTLAGYMRMRHAVEIWPKADGTRAGRLDVRDVSGNPVITLDGASGESTVKTLNITGGADIAEPFQMSGETIPKGAVVVIDEHNPGKLRLSDQAYDTRVAGIVSGANGINPGLALHQEGVIEGGQNVALTGRVHALADAAGNSIKPGDLLTTSDTPGHVMKASDRERRDGAIIGKAMSSLESGKGFVLVLVNLQ